MNFASTRTPSRSAALAATWAAAALLVCLSVQGCKKSGGDDDDAGPKGAAVVTVQAEKAATGSLTETVQADTVLVPVAQAAIVPKISSPIRKFLVQRGDRVRAGQALAELESADLAASVTDTRGTLEQAQATFNTTSRAQVVEDLQQAKLNVEQTKSALAVQKAQTDSRANLLQQGAIPRRDYDTSKAALVAAQAAYDIAVQHLSSLEKVSQQATVQNAQGGLTSARGKYEAAESALHYATVRSPINGVITDRPLYAGEMAQAGQPLLTVMDTSVLLAKVHLPQAKATLLKVGNKGSVTVQGTNQTAEGTVSLISPALDAGSTTLEVWLKLPNAAAKLRPGTPVHVSLETRTLDNVITVPAESIIATKSGATAVMVIGADGAAHQREVKLGISDGKDTQVLDGVKPGELIVTTGSQSLEDGTKVKVGAAEDDDDKKPAAGEPKDKADKGAAADKEDAK